MHIFCFILFFLLSLHTTSQVNHERTRKLKKTIDLISFSYAHIGIECRERESERSRKNISFNGLSF